MESGKSEGLFNVGCGQDFTIRELAQQIMDTVEFEGDIVFDASKPDGTPRKLLSIERMEALGWRAKTTLADGIRHTFESYLATCEAQSLSVA